MVSKIYILIVLYKEACFLHELGDCLRICFANVGGGIDFEIKEYYFVLYLFFTTIFYFRLRDGFIYFCLGDGFTLFDR